jgi:hypothetical protein
VGDATVIAAGPGDGGPGRLYLFRDGAAQPSHLGVADSVVATSQPGRVYTVTWTRGTARLAEIDLNGREHWGRTLPRTVRVVRGVAGGLLISFDEDSHAFGEELQVVDPRSGRVLRRLGSVGSGVTASVGQVVATCGPREVARFVASGEFCKLIAFDLRSGARRDYALPYEGRGLGPGILSPGDHLLALSFPGVEAEANIEEWRSGVVHVLDLRTGAWAQVPGVGTAFLVEPLLAWSPSGDWLALSVYWPDHKNLAYWQVGSAELRLQPERLPGGWKQGVLPSGLVALPG